MSRIAPLIGERAAFRLRDVLRRLWVRVVLFSLSGVALALITARIAPWLPYDPRIDLVAGAVDDLLGIVATSMLAVTTFSISIMVAAYGRATSNATPRSVELLADDPVAQTTLGIFIGSFAFSIVGIIGLSAGAYHDGGRIILFLATVAVIVLIAWALIRWIDQLNDFGRTGDIIARLTDQARQVAVAEGCRPSLGMRTTPAPGVGPESWALHARETGYLRHVDAAALEAVAASRDAVLALRHPVGAFVHAGDILAQASRSLDAEAAGAMGKAFTIGPDRSFAQDPHYGLVVLSEVASRALSPAVNDPGTAIDVVRAGTRVLLAMHDAARAAQPPCHGHLHGVPFDLTAAYFEFFDPIARDGAGLIEVQATLQQTLAALAGRGGGDAARAMSEAALRRAAPVLTQPHERRRLRAALPAGVAWPRGDGGAAGAG